MVSRRNQFHEMLPDHLRIFAVHCTFQVGIHNAQVCDFLAYIVIHQFGVILCADACQRLSLRLRNTQALECILDILRHIRPFRLHLGIRANVGNDVVHVQPVDGRTPVRHFQFVVDLERVQTKLLHPYRIVLLFGDLFDQRRRQTGIHLIEIGFFIFNIIDTSVNVCDLLFFFHVFHPFGHPAAIIYSAFS